jgi:uncharacterized repeat protein (TIGR03843 family)
MAVIRIEPAEMNSPTVDPIKILQQGEITLKGEFLWGSNYTFLVDVELGGETLLAVYKPTRGERRLWDFPAASLARREVAAYLVSEALEWNFVPITAYRDNAPLGPGSLQHFVEHDPDYHYFNFSPEDLQRLLPVAIFDLLINNADRKGSHILRDPGGHLWLIDHGLSFHVQDKLRTVIWDFVGETIPDDICENLKQFHKQLSGLQADSSELVTCLLPCINSAEVRALAQRAEQLVNAGHLPAPDLKHRFYPWPQI